MTIKVAERKLEAAIECALLAGGPDACPGEGWIHEERTAYGDAPGGYSRRTAADYDRERCLDPQVALEFVYATQPKTWEAFAKQLGTEARERFLSRLSAEVAKRGTLDVLRNGIKSDGQTFRLAYLRPVSGLNEETQRLYEANRFTVIRQLRYSTKMDHSLDMALFLNGLPIFTAELKEPLTGQTVEDAVRQYRQDRDPKEPLFAFERCLAHFAVDADLVQFTTRLAGPQTRFVPFNKGRDGGAGNPPNAFGFATAYLWEDVWARDSVLDLVEHFVHSVDEEESNGAKTGQRQVIFPRYHQLDAVRRLVADARSAGPGQSYLVQHSAGSGKSNTIAWLAHRLSTLHDDADQRVFDSIVVITDRRVLDRQLQRTVRQFQKTLGVVENIDQTSRQLREALEAGKTIIVTTLQKFPVIASDMGALPGKRFAVIVDEAHSWQSGESTKSLKQVLSAKRLEDAAAEEEAASVVDLEDRIVEQMRQRGRQPNVSTFAFTATPKNKTLELFGNKQADGEYAPFSLYTMRQAIEEGFILDVLENYTTYKVYWRLLKKVEDDPHFDHTKASYLLRQFVDLHEHAIDKKVAIMLGHFTERVSGRINGHAKAMIVTRSRLHAVRYRQAVDRWLEAHGKPFRTLVAFSGEVLDGGVNYTESGMNGLPETQTAETFKRDEFRILIAADKFQTGFDQPLLHTMYVDKRLAGVSAVQTLSRLNRVHPPAKTETMVLDFVNEAEDIQESFEPYYDRAILSEATDPNLLYDAQTALASFDLYDEADLAAFAESWFDPAGKQDQLHAALAPAVERFEALETAAQHEARGRLRDYVRLYAFLSQVITFVDADLERLYVFGRFLLRKLPPGEEKLPREVQQAIDMASYGVRQMSTGQIGLGRGKTELEPMGQKDVLPPPVEQLEPLSAIIQTLNERFGTDLTEKDAVTVGQLMAGLAANEALASSVQVNTPENARLTFEHVVNDMLQSTIDSNFKFYKRISDDDAFARFFIGRLFEEYLRSRR